METFLNWMTLGIEIAGVAVLVIGITLSVFQFLKRHYSSIAYPNNYHTLRADLGHSILLGLEFLVAADIISTVAIEPTLNSLAVLAGIVLVRTFLSMALEIEIEGRFPWRKAAQQENFKD